MYILSVLLLTIACELTVVSKILIENLYVHTIL